VWNSGIFFLERPINFLLATEFVSQFTLRVGEIKVSNGLRDCEELVNIVSAGEHLMVSPTYLSSDPDAAHESVRRLIAMNLDVERLLVGHGDDVYFGAKENMARIFAGPRP